MDPNWANIREAKRQAYRYCIFGDSYGGSASSGLAELGGNDFMVTLGSVPTPPREVGFSRGQTGCSTPTDDIPGTPDQQAGTFMHELGHTLGLQHGGDQVDLGPDGIPNSGDENVYRYNYKPNYHSVMNYTGRFRRQTTSGWGLDYSHGAVAEPG